MQTSFQPQAYLLGSKFNFNFSGIYFQRTAFRIVAKNRLAAILNSVSLTNEVPPPNLFNLTALVRREWSDHLEMIPPIQRVSEDQVTEDTEHILGLLYWDAKLRQGMSHDLQLVQDPFFGIL